MQSSEHLKRDRKGRLRLDVAKIHAYMTRVGLNDVELVKEMKKIVLERWDDDPFRACGLKAVHRAFKEGRCNAPLHALMQTVIEKYVQRRNAENQVGDRTLPLPAGFLVDGGAVVSPEQIQLTAEELRRFGGVSLLEGLTAMRRTMSRGAASGREGVGDSAPAPAPLYVSAIDLAPAQILLGGWFPTERPNISEVRVRGLSDELVAALGQAGGLSPEFPRQWTQGFQALEQMRHRGGRLPVAFHAWDRLPPFQGFLYRDCLLWARVVVDDFGGLSPSQPFWWSCTRHDVTSPFATFEGLLRDGPWADAEPSTKRNCT